MIRLLFLFAKSVVEMEEGPPSKKPRFAVADEEATAGACATFVPVATKKCYEFLVRVFESFCQEIDTSIDLKLCEPKTLNDVLCRFYVGLRNKKGDLYKKPERQVSFSITKFSMA